MSANVFDRSKAGFLIVILPLAIVIMILFTAWKWILLFVGLSLVWTIWQNYQWIKWSKTLDPVFHQLVSEHQGCLTPMDLSQKTNLNGWTAKKFLDRKAEEFGAQRKDLGEEGTVYYFLTANALGSIFADSDPDLEESEKSESTTNIPRQSSGTMNISKILEDEETSEEPAKLDEIDSTDESTTNTPNQPSVMNLSKILEDEETPEEPETPSNLRSREPEENNHSPTSQASEPLSLIQSELAKRLDTNSSTIGRRKSDPDFAEWTQSRDPEGIAWKYVRKTRNFVPANLDQSS